MNEAPDEAANKPLKQSAAPRREHHRLPLARGELPRARSSPPDASAFPDAAAATAVRWADRAHTVVTLSTALEHIQLGRIAPF
jgi:hypothetical protein